jgi:hypothetical protein
MSAKGTHAGATFAARDDFFSDTRAHSEALSDGKAGGATRSEFRAFGGQT